MEVTEKKIFPHDKGLYPGNYIIDIAKKIVEQKNIKDFKNFDKVYEELSKESLKFSIELIKNNLENLGVKHDNFVYESELIKNEFVSKTINKLQKDNYVYRGKLQPPKGQLPKNWEKRDQLLFNSTMFGDDADRALQKEDKTWTYFASDIAYHDHKIKRNFDILINILGSDHAGYIKRITSAVKAISKNKVNLICKVSQLVKLFKEGKPFKMSKRKGDYITVHDLVNEVGKDATRFIMLNRSGDAELDFDFTKVKEKSRDNPLYYVQYCYARISSVFRNINKKISEEIKIKNYDFSYSNDEIKIIKKISQWPKCIELSSSKLEPHRVPVYLYELASDFHSYWNLGKDNEDKRFIGKDNKVSDEKIVLLKTVSNVIKSGMDIIGVDAPEKM